MKVMPVNGSPTLFDVESRTVQCPQCSRKYSPTRRVVLLPGDSCPSCGAAVKRMLPHRVDAAMILPIGKCGCWQGHRLAKEAERLTLKQRLALSCREQEALRCEHLRCARNFLLNREMGWYEIERLKNGNGRKEEHAA